MSFIKRIKVTRTCWNCFWHKDQSICRRCGGTGEIEEDMDFKDFVQYIAAEIRHAGQSNHNQNT